MNEKCKKFFSSLFAFVSGIVSCFLGWTIFGKRNRPAVDGVGEHVNRVGELEQSEAETVGRIADGVRELQEAERTDAERIKRSKEIIEEIRSKKQQ